MNLKDGNWKRKERNSEKRDNNTPSTNKTSTERVRKHRENKRLIVQYHLNFQGLHENLDDIAAKLENIYQQLQTVKQMPS